MEAISQTKIRLTTRNECKQNQTTKYATPIDVLNHAPIGQ